MGIDGLYLVMICGCVFAG